MSGRSRKRPLDNIPRGSANLIPLGSRSTPGGLLPTPNPSSSETRRHSDVAVRPSRHSEEGRRHSNAVPPPSKVSRLAGCELAGEEAELQFPEGKTTLNNALQLHLRRLNKTLEYDIIRTTHPVTRQPIFRCLVDVPYPEPFTAVGEGLTKKEAEKRGGSAACLKLLEMGFINSYGKRVEKQHIDVVEDQKPKLLEVSMSNQIELFDAVSRLSEASSFPNWANLKVYYESQKRGHQKSSKVESTLFQLSLFPYSTATVANQPQYASVMLPSILKSKFPSGQSTCLATLSCPCCFQHVSVTLSHLGGTCIDLTSSSPSPRLTPPPLPESSQTPIAVDSPPTNSEPSFNPTHTMCAFTGKPYEELSVEELNKRNAEMQAQLNAMMQKYQNPPPDTPQYTAQNLPVASMRNEILTQVNNQPMVIVSGLTGSGKTTQVPQFILDNYTEHNMAANCNIIVTQPRRISAVSIAERVAVERGETVGMNVGYQVRLDSCMPQRPGRILFCTTGILLMRLRRNPRLEGVSHVIVDEVHERDVNADFLLILLREIVRSGCPVKVILMSASVNAEMFATYFRRAGISPVSTLTIQGRVYPVTDHYLPEIARTIHWREMGDEYTPDTNVDLVASVVVYLARSQPMGGILVFLPGWDDIMAVLDLLNSRLQAESHRYTLLPLHSMLSSDDQQRVFRVSPVGVRKIILATNIAESSVTIDDIVYVVNTGTVKVKTFDPTRKISCLATQWSSRASITQRRGRAGRCQPGHCYNLFSKQQQGAMSEYDTPEMQRTPLEELVLQAKVLNPWQRVAEFLSKALNPPLPLAISTAVEGLQNLGALSDKEDLTPMGKVLAELPIEPRVGRLILLGAILGTLDPALTIAASMGYKDPFLSPPTKRREADEVRSKMASGCYSDHLLLLKALAGWQEALRENQEFVYIRENFLHRGSLRMIEGLRKQFLMHLESLGLRDLSLYNQFSSSEAMIRAVLTAGLFPSVVKMAKMMESGGVRGEGVRRRARNGFKTIQDGRVFMHPSSVNSEKVFPSHWFVYYEKIKTTKVYIRDSTMIHPLHLLLFAGKTLTTKTGGDGASNNTILQLEGKDWFAFETAPHLASLLQCAREGIALVLNTGLAKGGGRIGRLPGTHVQFLKGLNVFLESSTVFENLDQ